MLGAQVHVLSRTDRVQATVVCGWSVVATLAGSFRTRDATRTDHDAGVNVGRTRDRSDRVAR